MKIIIIPNKTKEVNDLKITETSGEIEIRGINRVCEDITDDEVSIDEGAPKLQIRAKDEDSRDDEDGNAVPSNTSISMLSTDTAQSSDLSDDVENPSDGNDNDDSTIETGVTDDNTVESSLDNIKDIDIVTDDSTIETGRNSFGDASENANENNESEVRFDTIKEVDDIALVSGNNSRRCDGRNSSKSSNDGKGVIQSSNTKIESNDFSSNDPDDGNDVHTYDSIKVESNAFVSNVSVPNKTCNWEYNANANGKFGYSCACNIANDCNDRSPPCYSRLTHTVFSLARILCNDKLILYGEHSTTSLTFNPRSLYKRDLHVKWGVLNIKERQFLMLFMVVPNALYM